MWTSDVIEGSLNNINATVKAKGTDLRVPDNKHTRRRIAPDARRAQLVQAALDLLADHDAETLSMEQIGQRAGASAALVHHYFGTKQALVVAALQAAADELIARVAPDPDDPALAQLAAGLGQYLDYLEAHPVSWSALLRAGSTAIDPVAQVARAVDDHAYGLVLSAVSAAEPVSPALAAAVRGWIAHIKAVCLEWLTHGDLDRAQVETLLSMAFVGAVQAAAAADPAAEPALRAVMGGES
jgi:AcrR family transcriptional regulator